MVTKGRNRSRYSKRVKSETMQSTILKNVHPQTLLLFLRVKSMSINIHKLDNNSEYKPIPAQSAFIDKFLKNVIQSINKQNKRKIQLLLKITTSFRVNAAQLKDNKRWMGKEGGQVVCMCVCVRCRLQNKRMEKEKKKVCELRTPPQQCVSREEWWEFR